MPGGDGNKNQGGLSIERQSSDFALGDTGRQESELPQGYVRAPRDMKPPTPIEWGRGDSLMWDQPGAASGADATGAGSAVDKSTPLAGYGREKDPFADAVPAITSPSQQHPAAAGYSFSNAPSGVASATSLSRQQQQQQQSRDAGQTFAAMLRGRQPPAATAATAPSGDVDIDAPLILEPSPPHGSDYNHKPQQQQRTTTFVGDRGHQQQQHGSSSGGFEREPSSAAILTRQRTSEADLAMQYRTQSQVLTDELHRQSKTFPPPPPVLGAPTEQRRSRAARWYYFATKWDITHEQPPPPRSPLPLMDQESDAGNANNAGSGGPDGSGPLYPYRGDFWLDRCEHWFNHTQSSFSYPGCASRVQVNETPADVVMQHALLA